MLPVTQFKHNSGCLGGDGTEPFETPLAGWATEIKRGPGRPHGPLVFLGRHYCRRGVV